MTRGVFEVSRISETTKPELGLIVKKLMRGAVIPFVGAGMSANNLNVGPHYGIIIALVEQELEHLQKALGNEFSGFLEAFKQQYLLERKHPALQSALLKQKDHDPLLELGAMRDFRIALAKFIVLLTGHYNTQLANQKKYYFSNYTPVEYSKNELGRDAALEMLQKLRILESELFNHHDTTARRHIGHRLIKMALGSLGKRYDPNDGKKLSGSLDADHIVWLTDILWLTIVIWLPLYPTTRELAAEMSLVSDRQTRSSERRLIRTAECFSDQSELTRHIVARFGKDEKVGKDEKERHLDALIMDSHAALASAAAHSSMKGHQSVIFTTNFDRGLERALERIISTHDNAGQQVIGYRVIYPVLVEQFQSRRARKKNSELAPKFGLEWLARDWFSADRTVIQWVVSAQTGVLTDDDTNSAKNALMLKPPYLSSKAAFLSSEATSATEELETPFPGPVIVKLHGAPLEQLGELAKGESVLVDGKEDSVRHYLVVSEHQYIDTIINSQDTSPEWLTSVLKQKDICFQGYSIEDWNVRLQLARQPKKGDETGEISRSAIVRGASDAEEGLFHRLGIGLAAQELGQLIRAIYNEEQSRRLLEDSFDDRNFEYLK